MKLGQLHLKTDLANFNYFICSSAEKYFLKNLKLLMQAYKAEITLKTFQIIITNNLLSCKHMIVVRF